MKPIVRLFLALPVLAGLLFIATTSKHVVQPVHAQNGCSVTNLNGAYAFTQLGFEGQGQGTALFPLADLAVFNFNGAGNFSVTYTDISPGKPGGYKVPVFGGTGSGTYTVNSDCTGSISITNAGVTFNTVIIGGGTEVFGINTTPFIVATSDFKKQY